MTILSRCPCWLLRCAARLRFEFVLVLHAARAHVGRLGPLLRLRLLEEHQVALVLGLEGVLRAEHLVRLQLDAALELARLFGL